MIEEIIFCAGIFRVEIVDNNLCTSLILSINELCKLKPFFIVKQIFRVCRKLAISVIWRVEINESALIRESSRFPVVSPYNRCILQLF